METKEQLLEKPEIQKLLNHAVATVNEQLAAHENVKRPTFLFDEWNTDNGMLSQTLKLKRRNLQTRYAQVIEDTYKTA